jgi:hypothetical protein
LRVVRGPVPHHPPHWWHHHHGSHGWAYGTDYDGGYAAVGDAGAAPVGTCPGNCLSKSYLEDGTVVFNDRCTHESATAAPLNASPRG